MISILRLSEIPQDQKLDSLLGANTIFFETAPASFTSLDSTQKKQFEYRYFGIYAESPEWFYLAMEDSKVMGYLAGAVNTLEKHYTLNPYLLEFKEPIHSRFPSHLHINITEGARGLGLGARLFRAFAAHLEHEGSPGVHIVTSTFARNVGFYEQNGFERVQESPSGRLLMGRSLA